MREFRRPARFENMPSMESKVVTYGESLRRAERALSRRDPVLRQIIKRHGPCSLRPRTRHFEILARSIVSQQLSTRVADTIIARLKKLCATRGFPTAQQILATADHDMRAIGMSWGKVAYVKDLAARYERGDLKRISRSTDEQITEVLIEVKGVGAWTAHMFLIFALGRLNVLPVGDLGIRRAIERAYGLAALPTAAEIETIAAERGWSPYCSVASWFLWRSLGDK